MKFKVGNIVNDKEINEKTIEIEDYVSALEHIIAKANLYCEPADETAKRCVDKINEFCRENNRLKQWWD